ncbi:MAG TPA: translation elongation factor Ts [Patescibacteria group bacterium]|nr:translation elongation factor Ts [Patescibacteria group bacterium]
MLEKIKKLREQTGAGMVDVKKALEEVGGDETKALEILRSRGQERAAKKSDRQAHEGVVVSYIHSNGKTGAIVKLMCETDFVAMNEEFKDLARDIAMHVVAMNPENIETLLAQPFVKDPEITVNDLVVRYISKIGENIQVGEFVRMEI